MSKKKLLLLIIIVAILIILGIILFSNRLGYRIENVTDFKYNILFQNNKYGVIDDKGNTLIDAIYDNIQIPNPSKPVFICMGNYDIEKKQYEIKVFTFPRRWERCSRGTRVSFRCVQMSSRDKSSAPISGWGQPCHPPGWECRAYRACRAGACRKSHP